MPPATSRSSPHQGSKTCPSRRPPPLAERLAGLPSEKYHQCHGSFDTARCLECRAQCPLDTIRPHIEQKRVPYCEACQHPDGVIKPDVVFFGESLGSEFSRLIDQDKHAADLLIVMGSSLKVCAWAPLMAHTHAHMHSHTACTPIVRSRLPSFFVTLCVYVPA